MSPKITDWAAATERLDELARGLPCNNGGFVELGKRIAREPNPDELWAILIIYGSSAKIDEANGRGTATGAWGRLN